MDKTDEIIKRKLDLVKEAIEDWEEGILPDFSAITAIKLIVSPRKPSLECELWAKTAIEKHRKRE